MADAAVLVGIGTTSVYVAWRAEHPDRPPRGGRVVSEAMRAAQRAPFATLREVMLDHVPRRGATAREIFADTLHDYGTCHERRLWRALRVLVQSGRVRRIGAPCTGATYARSKL